ncbi:MAG: HAD-IIB family hydrolase [Gammaproteobacteria bacterium]|nr:HAD-IIB family hydrolase [Gammaproteobacteria bacterium]
MQDLTPFGLFSDLDRTILPNGAQPESHRSRPALRTLVAHSKMKLVYVSGRDERLLKQAIREYSLPIPRFAVGDVGATIYDIDDHHWRPLIEWRDNIALDWDGASNNDIAALFRNFDRLRLQEPEKQSAFKLSYYTAMDIDNTALVAEMQARLYSLGVRCSLVWSVDEVTRVGLLDVLPATATKLHAVEFLMARMGLDVENSVFAGDSGNDLPLVSSGRLQSVLVKNACADVIAEARQVLSSLGVNDRLYVASGNFYGMNGNYCAGVLEGLAHYLPDTLAWMGLSQLSDD